MEPVLKLPWGRVDVLDGLSACFVKGYHRRPQRRDARHQLLADVAEAYDASARA